MPDWDEVARDPDYQALPLEKKDQVRHGFFDEHLAPNVPAEKLDSVRSDFLRDTDPGAQPPDQPGLGSFAMKLAGLPGDVIRSSARSSLDALGRLRRAGQGAGVAVEQRVAEQLGGAPEGNPEDVEAGIRERFTKTAERASRPGFVPQEGEKLGATVGATLGDAPLLYGLGIAAPAFEPAAAALTSIPRMLAARAAHTAVVFGAQAAVDAASETQALTGKVDPMTTIKAGIKGAAFGAPLGAAGAVPALVSGKMPALVTKMLTDRLASRLAGATVAGAAAGGATALGGGSKEDVTAQSAAFFLMDLVGNANFDETYRRAAKDQVIKPTVDMLVGSGLPQEQAVAQARAGLERMLAEDGRASAAIKESPQYADAVKAMTEKYAEADPSMEPAVAEHLARRRLDVAFANGEMTVAELAKFKLEMKPEAPAPEDGAIVPVQPAPPPEAGAGAAPGPVPQPEEGAMVVYPSEGGEVSGRVVGYHPETGHPVIEVGSASGARPAGERGDLISAPAEALRVPAEGAGSPGAEPPSEDRSTSPREDQRPPGEPSKVPRDYASLASIERPPAEVKAQLERLLGEEARARGMQFDDRFILQAATAVHRDINGLYSQFKAAADARGLQGQDRIDFYNEEFAGKMKAKSDQDYAKLTMISRHYPEIAAKVPHKDPAAEQAILEGFQDVQPEAPLSAAAEQFVRGGPTALHEMTPKEYAERFPGAPPELYVKAADAAIARGIEVPEAALKAHPELKDAARAKRIEMAERDMFDNHSGQPVLMKLLRARGGLDIDFMKEKGGAGYGEIRGMDLLGRGIARHGGALKGLDAAAELAAEAGIIPERDINLLLERLDYEARLPRSLGAAAAGYEERFPEEFGQPQAQESWTPERLQAALDRASIVPGQSFKSKGFWDPVIGRVPRGKSIEFVAADLEHGVILATYEGHPVMVQPRDVAELTTADAANAPAGGPSARDIGARAKAATGVVKTERYQQLAESQILRLKLLNQQRGSIVGARAGFRKAYGQMMEQFKAGRDIRRELNALARESLRGLHASSTDVGRIGSMIANAQTEKQLYRAMDALEQVTGRIYRRQLVGEIKKVVDRALDSTKVDVNWKARIKAALADIELSGHTTAKMEELKARAEFVAHAEQSGQASTLPRELLEQVKIVARKPLDLLSEAELEQVRDTVLALEDVGRKVKAHREMIHDLQKQRAIVAVVGDVVPAEKSIGPVDRPESLQQPAMHRPGTPEMGVLQAARNKIAGALDFAADANISVSLAQHVFDLADGSKGYQGAHSNVYRILESDHHDYRQEAHATRAPILAAAERLKITPAESERIHVVLTREQRGGLDHLIHDRRYGATPDAAQKYVESVKLNAREAELAKLLRDTLNNEASFKRIAGFAKDVFNVDVEKEPDYYPFIVSFGGRPGPSGSPGYEDLDVVARVQSSFRNKFAEKTVEQGFLISRKEGARSALREDAVGNVLKHLDDVAYMLNAQKNIRLYAEVFNSEQYERAAGPIITKVMRDQMTLMARKGGTDGAKRIGWLDSMNRKMSALPAWRLSSALVHLSTMPLLAGEVGPVETSASLAQALYSSEWDQFLRAHFPQVRERVEAENAWLGADRRTALEGGVRKGFWLLQRLQQKAAEAAAIAGYKRSLAQRGLPVDLARPDKQAILDGTALMNRTQPSPMFNEMSLALSGSHPVTGNVTLDKVLFKFEGPMMARWSYLYHDVLANELYKGHVLTGGWKLGMVGLSFAAEAGVRLWSKEMIAGILAGMTGAVAAKTMASDEFEKRYFHALLNGVPIFNKFWSMASQKRLGAPLIDTAIDAASKTYQAVNQAQAHKNYSALKSATAALTALGELAGIPGASTAGEAARDVMKRAPLHAPRAPHAKKADR